MNVQYAPLYIDEIFERRDALALHSVISVRSRGMVLPDECALFNRTFEWLGSDWQYYESLKAEDISEVRRLLMKFGMADILEKFDEGRMASPDSKGLDLWYIAHQSEVEDRLFCHAKLAVGFLKKNEG